MTFRSDRAAAIIRQIEEHPETWDQGLYRSKDHECQTAFCFAGWAQVHAGHPSMGTKDCRDDAMAWLGLNERQAHYAFYSGRTLDELREFAKTGRVLV